MERPIGVFDSGVGGISVLKELYRIMPNENFIFYGDSLHAPYGTKTVEEIQHFSVQICDYFMEKQVKAIVVACNTATSAAVSMLREKYPVPIIGIEPALKPAVLNPLNHQIVVMATPLTLREKKFHDLLQQYVSKAQMVLLPCPRLVEFIEAGEMDGEGIRSYIREQLSPYPDVDAIILGCTHFPFAKRVIQEVVGDQVRIYDGSIGTAKHTKDLIIQYGLLNQSDQPGQITYYNSLNQEMIDLSKRLFEY